jgi:adenylate kinase family enzyme
VQRVVILGSGGAGKSTLARALGERTGLPVVHLDRLYWKPGWVPTPDDEWHARQVCEFAAARWIADGNYSRTLDARLPRADTVVFVDFPPWRTIPRVLRRWARNRGRAVQAAGCPERLDREFLWWVATYRRRSRPRVRAAIARDAQHAKVVVLRTPREVASFLAST